MDSTQTDRRKSPILHLYSVDSVSTRYDGQHSGEHRYPSSEGRRGAAYYSGFMMGGWCCCCVGCWGRRGKRSLRLWGDARWSSGDRGGWLVEVKGASAGQRSRVRQGRTSSLAGLWAGLGEDGMGGGRRGSRAAGQSASSLWGFSIGSCTRTLTLLLGTRQYLWP